MACFRFKRKYAIDQLKAGEDGASSPVADPFVASKLVVGLTKDSFNPYLNKKDIALVFFYDKEEPQCSWSKRHFKKAAEQTKRLGHGYAAIDCDKEAEFCIDEDVPNFPHFKMYLKGAPVDFFRPNDNTFIYSEMIKWVEGIHVPPSSKI